jgi:hypothetical protein
MTASQRRRAWRAAALNVLISRPLSRFGAESVACWGAVSTTRQQASRRTSASVSRAALPESGESPMQPLNAAADPAHDRDRHRVSDGLVSGSIRGGGDPLILSALGDWHQRVIVGEALEPLAFLGGEAADCISPGIYRGPPGLPGRAPVDHEWCVVGNSIQMIADKTIRGQSVPVTPGVENDRQSHAMSANSSTSGSRFPPPARCLLAARLMIPFFARRLK